MQHKRKLDAMVVTTFDTFRWTGTLNFFYVFAHVQTHNWYHDSLEDYSIFENTQTLVF